MRWGRDRTPTPELEGKHVTIVSQWPLWFILIQLNYKLDTQENLPPSPHIINLYFMQRVYHLPSNYTYISMTEINNHLVYIIASQHKDYKQC